MLLRRLVLMGSSVRRAFLGGGIRDDGHDSERGERKGGREEEREMVVVRDQEKTKRVQRKRKEASGGEVGEKREREPRESNSSEVTDEGLQDKFRRAF